MPSHVRMKKLLLQGLLWLFLLEFRNMAMSLEPGYLDFDNLPDTNFSCVNKVIGGYYADLETNCQMFHVCTIGQLDEPMDIRFLCLNGTVFDQETRVCERIDEVDCSKSEKFYSLNLELYGNTQPPILEESPDTEYTSESRRTSPTTTRTTTPRPTRPRTTPLPFFTTNTPATTTRNSVKVITSHHFPVGTAADVRFNPEEINISLNPGAPPNIRQKQVPNPISFQQQSFSNSERNTRVTVTTHTAVYKSDKPNRVPLLPTPNPSIPLSLEHPLGDTLKLTTEKPKSIVRYGLTHNKASPTEINYGFAYQQTEESVEYHTELPVYQFSSETMDLRPPTSMGYGYQPHSDSAINRYRSGYYSTIKKSPHNTYPVPTTYRSHVAFSSSLKNPREYQPKRTEKPPSRFQLPLPLLPTLPPFTFSSPAPFTLGRHVETKRFTHNDHPRIIISASASVSDNNGRRLNYSLGTIGTSHILAQPPYSYDNYKEEDVGLDPFYHDVPKLKRQKRSVDSLENPQKEEDAIDVLKFLFNWYEENERPPSLTIPIPPDVITEINEQLAPITEEVAASEEEFTTDARSDNKQGEGITQSTSTLINDLDGNFNDTEYYDYDYLGRIKENIESVKDIVPPGATYRPSLNKTEKLARDLQEVEAKANNTFVDDGFPSDYVDDNYEPLTYDDHSTEGNVSELDKTEETLTQGTTTESSAYETTLDENNTTTESLAQTTLAIESSSIDLANERTTQILEESTQHNERYETTLEDSLVTTEISKEQDKAFAKITRGKKEKSLENKVPHGLITTTGGDGFYSSTPDELTWTTQELETTETPPNNFKLETTDYPFHTYSLPGVGGETTSESSLTSTAYLPTTTEVESTTSSDSTTTNLSPTTTEALLKLTSSGRRGGKLEQILETTTERFSTLWDSTVQTDYTTLASEPTSSEANIPTTPLPDVLKLSRNQNLRTRAPWYRRQDNSRRRESSRHRFSSLNLLPKNFTGNTTLDANATALASESNASTIAPELEASVTVQTTFDETVSNQAAREADIAVTLAPLFKSANPTKTKVTKNPLATTPISRLIRVQLRREKIGRGFVFNCFDKQVNQFYSDPRDCRLFHYCTPGYTSTQVLDMKFVCESGTYFDEEKLVCTKTRPTRCL